MIHILNRLRSGLVFFSSPRTTYTHKERTAFNWRRSAVMYREPSLRARRNTRRDVKVQSRSRVGWWVRSFIFEQSTSARNKIHGHVFKFLACRRASQFAWSWSTHTCERSLFSTRIICEAHTLARTHSTKVWRALDLFWAGKQRVAESEFPCFVVTTWDEFHSAALTLTLKDEFQAFAICIWVAACGRVYDTSV